MLRVLASDIASSSVRPASVQRPPPRVKILPFPTPVLEACFNPTNEVCNEIVAKNPKFKKV